MSVVPMKLITIAGPAEQLEPVITRCIVGKSFQPVPASELLPNMNGLYTYDQFNPFHEALQSANLVAEALGIALEYRPFEDKGLTLDAAKQCFAELQEQHEALVLQREQLETLIRDSNTAVRQLTNFIAFPERLGQLNNLKYVKFRFGRMPRETFDSIQLNASEAEEMYLLPVDVKKDFVYLVYVTPRNFAEKIDSMFGSMGFERIDLEADAGGTPQDAVAALKSRISQAEEALKQNDADAVALRDRVREEFLMNYSFVRYGQSTYEVRKYAAHTKQHFFVLSGWVPAELESSFEKSVGLFQDVSFSVDDPADLQDTQPPVLLKNNLIGRVFQPFVEMYGLPAYNEIDPSFFMGITYSILFGIMYGDLGQGLMLIAFGLFLYKKWGLWLGRILSSVGVCASIAGLFYGSVFGYEELLPGFHVLSSGANTTRILTVAVFIGVSLIAFSMLINIFDGIKQHNPEKVFFAPNGLAGLVFYAAVLTGGVLLLLFNRNIFSPVYIVCLIIVPLLLIFLREPLGKLAAGRSDWKPESIADFIMESFFELFETILSYVTNTVSFLRVGAYAISHAGMMMVVYMLGSTASGGLNYPVIIIGNILVMGIEGMLVCIQVLRLEFYEMFGRFYESGGVQFTPNIIDYKMKVE